MKLPCNCLGGEKNCGHLKIIDYKDKDCEIQLYKYGRKKCDAIYLNKKSIEKLIKFLQMARGPKNSSDRRKYRYFDRSGRIH